MINILIDKSGKTSKENIFLGNQHENLDETLHFLFPQEYKDYYKYITYSYSNNNQRVTGISPLVDDNFIVSSKITKCAGVWELNLICKTSPVDLNDKVIDLTENNSTKEHIFISNTINACVSGNSIDVESFNNVAIDENIANLYDSILALKNRVEENDRAHEQNEEIRKANELERQEAENARKANESERVSAEQLRVEAEAERASDETTRQSAETARANAETNRANAERLRTEAETNRVNAEQSRADNEELRATAETARQSAETNRVNAENERVSAETLRKQAESTRVSAETNRTQAETSRAEAENLRVSEENTREQAEQSRISAESQRVTAEATRESAERARVEAESARENAEQLRVTAENARAEAEANREGTISKLREDLDANTKADGITQRSLTALWDLNKGISYRFENDDEKAYTKTVPSGAKLGAVNKIGGRTIVYNQLFTEKETTVINGITATYADGIMTLNGTATENWINFSQMTSAMNVVAKFYIKMTIIKNDDKISFYYGWLNREIWMRPIASGSSSVIYSQTEDELEKYPNTGIADFGAGAVFNDVKIQIIIVNLTKMFGEGNEPTTTAEFESMFPNDYYPYNEGTLMNMSVNEVEEVGKNVFKCKNFSSIRLDGVNNPSLSNSYGTSINSIEPSNSVTVTQSKIAQENIPTSYENGYFCVSSKPFILNKDYIFSFDVIPSNKLITDSNIIISLNGLKVVNSVVTQDLQVSKRTRLYFNLTASNTKVLYFEIRNSGISGVFENFQLEEGSVNTAFSPYHENHYAIPQAIIELDGYGASGNYVDFAKKEYHKGNEIIDISDIIGDTFQEPIDVESGGSLTFKNVNGDGYQVAVSSEVQYVVSLKEVNP